MIFGHDFLNKYLLRQAKILTFDRVPLFKSQAVGMDSWVQSALKSILRGDPILNRLHDFSLLSSNSFLHPFVESKLMKKKFAQNSISNKWKKEKAKLDSGVHSDSLDNI